MQSLSVERELEEVNNDELKLDDREFSVSRSSRRTKTKKTTNKRQIAKFRQARESQEDSDSLSGDNGAVPLFLSRTKSECCQCS